MTRDEFLKTLPHSGMGSKVDWLEWDGEKSSLPSLFPSSLDSLWGRIQKGEKHIFLMVVDSDPLTRRMEYSLFHWSWEWNGWDIVTMYIPLPKMSFLHKSMGDGRILGWNRLALSGYLGNGNVTRDILEHGWEGRPFSKEDMDEAYLSSADIMVSATMDLGKLI